MKKVLVTAIVMLIACVASASRIDWSINLRDNTTFSEEWTGASAYSYVILGSGYGTATSPADFVAAWTPEFVSTDTIKKGATGTWNGLEALEGGVSGWNNTLVSGPYAVYVVVILTKGDQAIYASSGQDDDRELGIYTNVVDDTGYTDDEKVVGFTSSNSDWTTFTVPEPTVLALLALGVAGLALKRKNA